MDKVVNILVVEIAIVVGNLLVEMAIEHKNVLQEG